MRLKSILLGAGVWVFAASTQAVLTVGSGYSVSTVYSGSSLGGFGTDGSRLYVGDAGSVYSMNSVGGDLQSVGALPAGDNSIVSVNPVSGTVFATGGSYAPPFPYSFGRFTGSTFATNRIINGAYDAAFNAGGELFISANHEDLGGDGINDMAVYHFNQSNNQLTLVANIGGYSSGLAFDRNGNLFCGETSGIYSFDAGSISAVLGGGDALTLADGTLEALTSSSYLAFDASDTLYATRLDAFWNTELVAVDLVTDSAVVIGNGGGGHLAAIGDTLYTAGTDWSDFSSNIYAVQVPEPATGLLLLIGFGFMMRLRRNVTFRR